MATMSMREYAAFEGTHEDYQRAYRFTVSYLGRTELAHLNRDLPRGHHECKTFGWYWWWGLARPRAAPREERAMHFGPFTSSRRAYKAAMAAATEDRNAA